MRDTFIKTLIFLSILLIVGLSFFAFPLLRGILSPFAADSEIIEDLDNTIDLPTYEEEPYEEDPYPYYNEEEEYDEEEEEERERPTLVPEARERYLNNDIVAHIQIPGTAIDYLIVHTNNNSFYLYHDLWRNRTAAGTVFLDYLNSTDFSDSNSIIYGHNMRNGTKFHDIRMYRGREFFETNDVMVVTTVYDVLYYDIFAIFTTHINFNYIQVEFEEGEFLEMVEEIKSRSYHSTDVEVDEDDSILILSTCWGPVGTDYRLVLVGKLRSDDNYDEDDDL